MNLAFKIAEAKYIPDGNGWKRARKAAGVKSGAVKGVNVTKSLKDFFKEVEKAGADTAKIGTAAGKLSKVVDAYKKGIKGQNPDFVSKVDYLFDFDGVSAMAREFAKILKKFRPEAERFVKAWNAIDKSARSGKADPGALKALGKSAAPLRGMFSALEDTGDARFNVAIKDASKGAFNIFKCVESDKKLDSITFHDKFAKKLHKDLLAVQTGIKLLG